MPSAKLSEMPKLTAQQKKAFLALEIAGVEITQEMQDQILSLGGGNEKKEPVLPAARETLHSDRAVRESELVLRSLDVPQAVRIVACGECNLPFGTNYRYILYCSDECRAAATRRKFGLEYDCSVPEHERYYPTVPPAVIRPENLEALRKWARYILDLPVPRGGEGERQGGPNSPITIEQPGPAMIEAPPVGVPNPPAQSLLTSFQIL